MRSRLIRLLTVSLLTGVAFAQQQTQQQTQQAPITAQVQMVYPHQNAVSVPVSDSIVVQFAVPVNPATLTDSTFVVQGEISGWHQGQVTYDQNTSTATLRMNKPFAVGERATAVATTKILWDSAGQMVHTRGFGWAFFAKVPTKTYGTVDTTGQNLLSQQVQFPSVGAFGGIGDFDGDNIMDVAVESNNGSFIFFGNSNGSYTPIQLPYNGDIFSSDFLLRGGRDFLVANLSGAKYITVRGRSFIAGNKHAMSSGYAPQLFPLQLAGENDFVAGDGNSDSTVGVYFMDDSIPDFRYVRSIRGQATNASAFFDYDNDGQFDFVNVSDGGTFLYHNTGNAMLDSGTQIPAIGGDNIATGDFDEDGWADILVVRQGILELCRNNHDGTFAFDTIYPVGHPNFAYSSYALTVCDINGDGHLDAIFSWEHHDADTMHVVIALGDGHGNFTLAQDWKTVGSDQQGQLNYADLNGDGALDIVFSRLQFGQVVIMQNDTSIKPVSVAEPPVTVSGYSLSEIYPNPASQSETVNYIIPSSGIVNIAVYNEAGQLISTLANGLVARGSYTAKYDVSHLPSGIYFIRLVALHVTLTKQFVHYV